MQQMAMRRKELGLLFEINNDRLLSILIVAAAMAAVGWVGVEYAHSLIVEDSVAVTRTFL